MELGSLTLALAFLAGLASFASPCVLALMPLYISYLGGQSLRESAGRGQTLVHALAFVIGFSLVFVVMGAAVSVLGGLLLRLQDQIVRLGGVLVIIFGLHTIGILHVPALDMEKRFHPKLAPRVGFLASFAMGVVFSAGWTPCVGPILGAILLVAMSSGGMLQGAALLSAYSAGMAIPFLATAAGVGWAAGMMRRYGKLIRAIEIAAGAVLVAVGSLMVLGIFGRVLLQFSNLGF